MGRPENPPRIVADPGPPRGRVSDFAGRRPFLEPSIGLVLGILLGKVFFFPSWEIFLGILALVPSLWFFRGKAIFLPLFLLAFTGVGILRINGAVELAPHHVSRFATGDWGTLEGSVDSLPESKQKGRRQISSFVLASRNLVRKKEFFETQGKVQVFLFNPKEPLPYGARVRIRGKLHLPKTPRNPGEFDYRKYLASQGIHAMIEGYGPRSFERLEGRPPFHVLPLLAIQRARDALAHRLDQLFLPPVNHLLKALLLGIRKDLPEGLRDDFLKTGTVHLIAISGMNITLVAGSLFFLALWLGLPQKGAAGVGFVLTVSYVFLSGAGIPVIRAGWMAGLFFAGLLLERVRDLSNSLFFALFAILLFDPEAFFQVGFQLSFLSVLILISMTPRSREEGEGEWFQTLWILVGTFPLLAFYFHVFSWTSLFANLLAIPLFHLGILGGLASLLIGKVPGVGFLALKGTSFFLQAGVAWIQGWGRQPWGYFHLRPPSLALILLYYGALAFVFLSQRAGRLRSPVLRASALSLWTLTSAFFFLPPREGGLVLTALSVGQNELFHVEFPGRNHWLINTGRGAPTNQARWTMAPYLRRKGIRRLQGVLLTDFSRRHTGGLTTLFKNFSIDTLVFPASAKRPPELKPYFKTSPRSRTRKIRVASGDEIPVTGETGFRVLGEAEGEILLLLYNGDQKFLFLPAWKPQLLRGILERFEELAPLEGLIFPAFGEPSASRGGQWVSRLKPKEVVFSSRKGSLGPLLEFLQREGVGVYFLSETGALRFEFKEREVTVTPFLEAH